MIKSGMNVNVVYAYYINKKKIQFRDKNSDGEWMDMTQEPEWLWDEFDYRIKPVTNESNSRYIPFDTMEDVIHAMRTHGIKVINYTGECFDLYVNTDDLRLFGFDYNNREFKYKSISFSTLFEEYHFKDNTPCGKKW